MMDIGDKDVKKLLIIAIIAILAVLVFILVKPIVASIITGLILAYIFSSPYEKLNNRIKNKSLSAFIVSFIVIVIIILPFWFLLPIIGNQIFGAYNLIQSLDKYTIIKSAFPGSSEQFISQIYVSFDGVVNTVSKGAFDIMVNLLRDLPTLALHAFLILFVFFFTLRDREKFTSFVHALSPFAKSKEKLIIQQFKNITDSVVYGQIIIGIVQGLAAGLGFLVFGVEKTLILTLLAIFFAIIPIIGPFVVWIPVAIYMFLTASTPVAFAFLLYNLIFVSLIDNFLRSFIVARKTDISPAVILVGMIGGFFIFGILGMLLGPLILVYFLTFLKFYKEKNLNSLFSDEEKS